VELDLVRDRRVSVGYGDRQRGGAREMGGGGGDHHPAVIIDDKLQRDQRASKQHAGLQTGQDVAIPATPPRAARLAPKSCNAGVVGEKERGGNRPLRRYASSAPLSDEPLRSLALEKM